MTRLKLGQLLLEMSGHFKQTKEEERSAELSEHDLLSELALCPGEQRLLLRNEKAKKDFCHTVTTKIAPVFFFFLLSIELTVSQAL